MYSKQDLIDVITHMCNYQIDDGITHEEVIDLLVSCGCTLQMLKDIGFNKGDIEDYAYYINQITGEPISDVLESMR